MVVLEENHPMHYHVKSDRCWHSSERNPHKNISNDIYTTHLLSGQKYSSVFDIRQILEVEHSPALDCWISPPPLQNCTCPNTVKLKSLSHSHVTPPNSPTKHVHKTRHTRFLCDPLPNGHYSCNSGPILMVSTLSKREPFLCFLPPFNFPEIQLKVTSYSLGWYKWALC